MLTEEQMCLRVDVRQAFAALGPEKRRVMMMITVGGYMPEEVARATGMSERTVRRRYKAALRAMRERLQHAATLAVRGPRTKRL